MKYNSYVKKLLSAFFSLTIISLTISSTLASEQALDLETIHTEEEKMEPPDLDVQGTRYLMQSVSVITRGPESQRQRVGNNYQSSLNKPDQFKTKLKYFEEEFNVDVKVNNVSIQPDLRIVYYDSDGTMKIKMDDEAFSCAYYQGSVESDEGNTSKVVLSLCGEEMEGSMYFSERHFHIRPVKDTRNISQVATKEQYMGQLRDEYQRTNAKGNTSNLVEEEKNKVVMTLGPHYILLGEPFNQTDQTYDYIRMDNDTHSFSQKRRTRRSNRLLSETKYVELVLVNSMNEFTWLGSKIENNIKRMKQITNYMDSVYKPQNIRICLREIEIWNKGDKIAMPNNFNTRLMNFLNYRKNVISRRISNDNAMLVFSDDLPGTTIGMAPLSRMCTYEASASANQETNKDYSAIAGTMAHEMGHNFGMSHDGAGCACADRKSARKYCIMAAFAQFPVSTLFSSCSVNYLNTFLSSDVPQCLLNKPGYQILRPDIETKCGNNEIDPGEECDCGLPDFCTNKCCDAKTCKLVTGANCYAGKCCDESCRIKPNGTVCRNYKDECDLPEKCNGTSPVCPEDLYKSDGTHCTGGLYCYRGQCRSHAKQCRDVFGQAAAAHFRCYEFLNARGDQYGNCGTVGVYYRRCWRPNHMCGKLHCQGIPRGRGPKKGYGHKMWSLGFKDGYGQHRCQMFISSAAPGMENPQWVYNGVKCAHNKACLNQFCQPVSKITQTCQKNCNGRGTCTQKGYCVCNYGWDPPYCEHPTPTSITTTKAVETTAATTNATATEVNTNTVANIITTISSTTSSTIKCINSWDVMKSNMTNMTSHNMTNFCPTINGGASFGKIAAMDGSGKYIIVLLIVTTALIMKLS